MKVNLTYFKDTGKFYSSGAFDYGGELYEIWNVVKLKQETGNLPGLTENHGEFIVLVDVPEHENNHPKLIIPEDIKEKIQELYE